MDKDLPNWFGSQIKAQGLRLGESYLAALIDAAEHIQRNSSRNKSFPEIQEFLMYFERLTQQMMQSAPDQADITLRLNEDHEFIEYL